MDGIITPRESSAGALSVDNNADLCADKYRLNSLTHISNTPLLSPPVSAPLSENKTSIAPDAPTTGLNAEVEEWLSSQPVERNKRGKVMTISVARLISNNKHLLKGTRTQWQAIAKYYGIPKLSLYSCIYSSCKEFNKKCTLNKQQRNWLRVSLQRNHLAATITATALARYFCAYQSDLVTKDISMEQLAAFKKINPVSLKKRIYERKKRPDLSFSPVKTDIQQWLRQQGCKLSIRKDVAIKQLAKFYVENTSKFKEKKISVTKLCQSCRIARGVLYPQIVKLKRQQHPALLDEYKIAWLNANGPAKGRDGKGSISEVANFYLAEKDRLNIQHITLSNLATHYQMLLHSLIISTVRKKKAGNAMPSISAEEEIWLTRRLCAVNTSSCDTLATCYEQDPQRFHTELLRYRDLQRQPAAQLSRAARKYLRSLPLPEKKTGVAIVRYYLENLQFFVELAINHATMAEYFNLKRMTLNTQIRKQSAAWKKQQRASICAQVKLEPDSAAEDEAELWYQPQLFRRMPVVISQHDEELVLRHAQGPIWEVLAGVDLATLSITRSPDFPQLLSNPILKQAATIRLRKLIEAACNGTLQKLNQDEGYYHLLIDEQSPELGMGLYAAREIPAGFLLGIYPGVLYPSNQAFQQAAATVDSSFPVFAFQRSHHRARRKSNGIRKKNMKINSAIGGHLQTWPLVYVNTAEVSVDNRVLTSERNNLAAAIAGKEIIAYVATRDIHINEKLLIFYGEEYRITKHKPIKQEPLEEICPK